MIHVQQIIPVLQSLWQPLGDNPLPGLLLTLICYQFGLWLYQRCGRTALLHPIATSAPLIALLLYGLNVRYPDYQTSTWLLHFFLGPSVVAMAIPLYREFHHIRKLALPVLLVTSVGAIVAAACGVGAAWLVGASEEVLLALAPKSATTPIAIGIAENIGAPSTLTTGVVVFTGVVGVLMSPLVFRILRLQDDRLQGLILGVNAHGVGIARCFDLSPTAGAFATLAMGLTGTFTALTLPYVVAWF